MLVANDRIHLVGCEATITDLRPNASLTAALLAAIVVPGTPVPGTSNSYSTFRRR